MLENLPNELLFKIVDEALVDNDKLRAPLARMSSHLYAAVLDNARSIIREIFADAENSSLHRYIYKKFSDSDLAQEGQYLSLLREICSTVQSCLGCAQAKILCSKDIATMSALCDSSLEQAWPVLRREIAEANPYDMTIPDTGQKAATIRSWLYENTHLLANITYLNLSGLGLRVVPMELLLFTSLQTLDLSKNKLTYLPSEIKQLSALQELIVTQNRLYELPSTIGELPSLRVLYAERNQLTSLPNTLWNLSALSLLWLDDNYLTTLPSDIGKLTQLTSLHLGDNVLTSLPDTLGNLTHLTGLGLENNSLTKLPDTLCQLPALEFLCIGGNDELASLPEGLERDGLEIV